MKIDRRYFPFVVAGLVIAALYAIVVAWAYATGNWGDTQESYATKFGICVQNTVYERMSTIPAGVTPIYVCGKVDGATGMVGVYHLFQDTNGNLIDSRSFTLSPGVFFIPLALSYALEEGNYRLEFQRGKQIRIAYFAVQ